MIINGNSRDVLKTLPRKSVHCCATSPPYYGLRNYGTEGVIWGGDPNCQHVWEEVHPPGYRNSDTKPGPMQHEGNKNRENLTSHTCSKCGAWKGELGLEPTPEMYVQHLVEIFRELREVLRDDGTFWLNIGDSYSAKSTSNSGCKPKDLLGIPWMLAFALREDGWYLRADLPWVKRNSLPSSVTDRPCSSIEHVFLLTKKPTYYYDYIATMQPASKSYLEDKRPKGVLRQRVNPNSKYPDEGQFKKQDNVGNNTYTGFNARYEDPGTGLRFMRDSDLFFKTWQGLLHNETGEPMALVVNPRGYAGAHFACFPVPLVEVMILAGTSDRGVCHSCGKPWIRVIRKDYSAEHTGLTLCEYSHGSNANRLALLRQQAREGGEEYTTKIDTLGWVPQCTCNHNVFPKPYPAMAKDPAFWEEARDRLLEAFSKQPLAAATVVDPFGGSCATGVACDYHKRNFIGIEIKPDYCKLGQKRMEDENGGRSATKETGQKNRKNESTDIGAVESRPAIVEKVSEPTPERARQEAFDARWNLARDPPIKNRLPRLPEAPVWDDTGDLWGAKPDTQVSKVRTEDNVPDDTGNSVDDVPTVPSGDGS